MVLLGDFEQELAAAFLPQSISAERVGLWKITMMDDAAKTTAALVRSNIRQWMEQCRSLG